MKKIISIGVFLGLLGLAVSACNGSPDVQPEQSAPVQEESTIKEMVEDKTAESVVLSDDYEDALSVETQLALGIMKLDETEYPVEGEEAAELLPLWKAIRSLNESETAAEEEIDAVFNQIMDTLSNNQIRAIAQMRLTYREMRTIAEEKGINIGKGGGKSGNMTPEQQATAQAMRESGKSPGGMMQGKLSGVPGKKFPEGAPVLPSGEVEARLKGAKSGVNPYILDAVIAFLEEKATP